LQHAATRITNYLQNGGTLEKAQAMANHESARTTKFYDRRDDKLRLDEVRVLHRLLKKCTLSSKVFTIKDLRNDLWCAAGSLSVVRKETHLRCLFLDFEFFPGFLSAEAWFFQGFLAWAKRSFS
jgi:hypothetical protein